MQARKDDGFALIIVYIASLRPMNKFSGNKRRFGKIFEKPSAGNFQAAKAFPDTRFRTFRLRVATAETDGLSKPKQLMMK